jgi:hypothetical protein
MEITDMTISLKDYFNDDFKCPYCDQRLKSFNCTVIDWTADCDPIVETECCRMLRIRLDEHNDN